MIKNFEFCNYLSIINIFLGNKMLITNLILAQISLLIFHFEIGIILWLQGQDIQNLIKKFIFESTLYFTVIPSDSLFLKNYCKLFWIFSDILFTWPSF